MMNGYQKSPWSLVRWCFSDLKWAQPFSTKTMQVLACTSSVEKDISKCHILNPHPTQDAIVANEGLIRAFAYLKCFIILVVTGILDWGATNPYYILESEIKMEPKHHLIEQEIHLPNLDVWVQNANFPNGTMDIYGCHQSPTSKASCCLNRLEAAPAIRWKWMKSWHVLFFSPWNPPKLTYPLDLPPTQDAIVTSRIIKPF